MSIVTTISERFNRWAKGWLILSVLSLFGIITIGLLLYETYNAIDIVTLDTKFFYTSATMFSTLESYSNAERSYLVLLYLTYDVIAPVLYTVGFSLVLSWLFQRGFNPDSPMKKLNIVPLNEGKMLY